MMALYRIQDVLGRERWTEQPMDSIVLRRDAYGVAVEDDLERARRQR